jgi:hypothetical protein
VRIAVPASTRAPGIEPDAKARRTRRAGMGDIGGTHRVTVHRRVVEAGDVARRADFLCEHEAERVEDRRPLDTERRHVFEHQLQGFVRADH